MKEKEDEKEDQQWRTARSAVRKLISFALTAFELATLNPTT